MRVSPGKAAPRSASAKPERISIRFERSGIRAGRAALAHATHVFLDAAGADLKYPDAEISILFCGEARMRELNRVYLGHDKPTDVLSFPAQQLKPERRARGVVHLGDICVCIPYALRENLKGRGHALLDEIALLLVHGLLHLVGHDHDMANRKSEMWAEQKRLLALPEARAFRDLAIALS